MKVAVEFSEAVSGHQLRDELVAVGGLPVVMQFRQLDDTLANTHSEVTPHFR